MQNWLSTIGTLLLTLTVTLIFNRLVGLPKTLKQQKEIEKQQEEQLKQENTERDARITKLEEAVNALPKYRAQSIQIQNKLQDTDKQLLDACTEIKAGIVNNQNILNKRLDRLENREKNSIRAKLLDEHRLFTDKAKNPMLAWSEMEHHAFFELVRDYEDLNGNDYIHTDVLPDMHRLRIILMNDRKALAELMSSRKL